MRKINDSKLYLFFGLTVLVIGVFLTIITLYSYKGVIPEVRQLLKVKKNVSKNYTEAYIILRNPQLFALYENFDSGFTIEKNYDLAIKRNLEDVKELKKMKDNTYSGLSVKQSIIHLDAKISKGEELTLDDYRYIDTLLERRIKGAKIGRNSAVFCFMLAIIAFLALLYEKKTIRSN